MVSDEIKHMDINEFQEGGYLQEVNRLVLHPCGLALEVRREDDEDAFRKWLEQWFDAVPDGPDHIDIALALLKEFGVVPGKVRLSGIWDYREDPEGIIFKIENEDQRNGMKTKSRKVRTERRRHHRARVKLFKSAVQSLYEDEDYEDEDDE